MVTVQGSLLIDTNGEAYLDAGGTGVTVDSTGSPMPDVWMMVTNRYLGGQACGDYPGVNTPAAFGPYNKGRLVKCVGSVTGVYPAEQCFYINDGSNLNDGTNHSLGIRVSWAWQNSSAIPIAPPATGWYVSITGISSSDASSGTQIYRVLRPRSQGDIDVYVPSDSTSPAVAITSPSTGTIQLASGQTTVQLAGTASDADAGVTSVQVGFTATGSQTPPATWYIASYNTTTDVWTYNWQNPQTQRIWAMATNFAGDTTTTDMDVTVSSATLPTCTGNGAFESD